MKPCMCPPFANFSSPHALIANARKASNSDCSRRTRAVLRIPRLGLAELSRLEEDQEMHSRQRAEGAKRERLLQRMGNGTPGQRYVHSIVCIVRVLIYTISKLQLALARSQGLSAEQLAQNNNAPGLI